MPSLTWDSEREKEGICYFGSFDNVTYAMIIEFHDRPGAYYQFKGLKTADLDSETDGMKGADDLETAKKICNVMMSAWIQSH